MKQSTSNYDSYSTGNRPNRGGRWAAMGSLALVCILIGVLIASNLDFTPHSYAQTKTNIAETGLYPIVDRNGEQESPFVGVVDHYADGVVNISAKTQDEERPWWFSGGHYATSFGSGFFFRDDGYVLTNNHVVNNAAEVVVRTSTGYEYEAKVVGSDPETDLAVLKVDPEEDITVIPFGNSDDIKVGDWAIAIGNPFPQVGLDRTVTVGVVSAKGRSNLRFGRETPEYQNYIQTDASINPGNSGGPLLNLRGECIGVNAAISSPTGSSVGIGFAIPINLARAIVSDLITSGRASRGWLGVWLSDVTVRDAKRQNLHAVRGVKIDSVFDGSPAERAGLKRGDIVIGFNKQEVIDGAQFSVLVSTVKKGFVVPLEVVRDGDHINLKAQVGDRDAFLASQEESRGTENQSAFWLGMEIVDYTPEMAQTIGAEHVEGVYVTSIYRGTPADRASISEGTIILKVDNVSVSSVTEIASLTRGNTGNKNRIPLIVQEPDGTIARKVIRQ